jgi:hypothetical protein
VDKAIILHSFLKAFHKIDLKQISFLMVAVCSCMFSKNCVKGSSQIALKICYTVICDLPEGQVT